MPKTMRDVFAKALEEMGEKEVYSKSGKYRTFTRTMLSATAETTRYPVTENGEPTFYFLGRSGSLRFGRVSSKSIPVSKGFKNKLLGIKDIKYTPMNGVDS